jgi:hypothetical protein
MLGKSGKKEVHVGANWELDCRQSYNYIRHIIPAI